MTFHIAITYRPNESEMQAMHSTLDDISEIRYLPDLKPYDRAQALEKADIILSRSFAGAEIEPQEVAQLKKARFIQLTFAGANNVPFAMMSTTVTVASNVGAFANPLAEHVLAMTLCLAKSIVHRHILLADGNFNSFSYSKELRGGVCGIIGMGGNGAAIARLMKGIGMDVHGINRSGTSTIDLDFIGTLADMDTLLRRSDVVVLTVPLNRETLNLIGRRELQIMKPDAILINVARGKVVVQQALYDHLKATPSFGVGIDTWWSEPGDPEGFKLDYPFFDLPNLIGSPHNADQVPGVMAAATKIAAENVRHFLEGKPIRGEVNREDYAV